jgi:antagonist of KipI
MLELLADRCVLGWCGGGGQHKYTSRSGVGCCARTVNRGSHTNRLDAASQKALGEDTWTVGSDSNRVGLRLDGPKLALDSPLELTSEGVAAGAVQLPPDGRAIIMGPEHPVTGGYPRIGQVIAVDLPRLAQCRPGDNVAFQWTDLARAVQLLTDAAPCWND